jgi:hypothetical protein
MADAREMAAIDAFNAKIELAGKRVLAIGLEDPASAVVFDNRQGLTKRRTGPVVDSDDYVAGIWIVDVSSPQEAHQLAEEASRACNRQIEVRALL